VLIRDRSRGGSSLCITLACCLLAGTASAQVQQDRPQQPYAVPDVTAIPGSAGSALRGDPATPTPTPSADARRAEAAAPPSPAVSTTDLQVLHLDGRIAEAKLLRGQQGRAGPWTGLAIGYSLGMHFVVSTIASAKLWVDLREERRSENNEGFNGNGVDGHEPRELRNARNLTLALAGTSLSFLVGGALCNWLLVHRTKMLGRADRKLRGLETERNELKLKLDASVDANSANAQVTFAF